MSATWCTFTYLTLVSECSVLQEQAGLRWRDQCATALFSEGTRTPDQRMMLFMTDNLN